MAATLPLDAGPSLARSCVPGARGPRASVLEADVAHFAREPERHLVALAFPILQVELEQ